MIACDNVTEKELLVKLKALLDKADIVIAHNGDSFDIKKINTRMIIHRLNPPSPYRTIDTKKEARKIAAFDSNSLENLGIDLGEGEKVKHRGFAMWEGCMAGNKKDWQDMKRYNKKDVDLLERVYLRFRSLIKNHPTTNQDTETCPNCDCKNTQKRGLLVTRKSKLQRFQCQEEGCGAWFTGKINKEKK